MGKGIQERGFFGIPGFRYFGFSGFRVRTLFMWFSQMRAQNAPINGTLMKEKAAQRQLYSIEWMAGIKFLKVRGECEGADHNTANEWIGKIYPNIILGYALNQCTATWGSRPPGGSRSSSWGVASFSQVFLCV